MPSRPVPIPASWSTPSLPIERVEGAGHLWAGMSVRGFPSSPDGSLHFPAVSSCFVHEQGLEGETDGKGRDEWGVPSPTMSPFVTLECIC